MQLIIAVTSAQSLGRHEKESMTTEDYLSYFFPFEPINFVKNHMESSWSITDNSMIAIAMTLKNKPQAVTMSFLYYQDFNILNEEQKQLYRQGMSAFGGIAPTYHVELLDRPTIVWDFHSLLLEIQMMLSFMLTDEKSSIKVCKHCDKAFIASRPNTVFCSPQCKNQYNVYKSRGKIDSDKKND